MVEVSSIHFYPVKSCRGLDLQQARINKRGLKDDRSYVLVGEDGTAITQRDVAKLALVLPELVGDGRLRLRYQGFPDLLVQDEDGADKRFAIVWGDKIESIDQGDAAALWFNNIVGRPCRLVRIADDFVRPVEPERLAGNHQVGFADSHPFVLISEESLADLNSKLDQPVPMNQFRPNIVVKGCAPFEEDQWKKIRIGSIEFDVSKPCARCVMITINQHTTEIGKEPMHTLANYRQVGKKVMFGQNLVHHCEGEIKVGDALTVIL